MPAQMSRLAPLAVLLLVLGLAACGGDEEATSTTTSTQEPGETGAEGPTGAGGPPAKIADIQACLEEEGHDVQRNPGTIGKSTGDLVVNSGVIGVVYVYDDAGAAAADEENVREYEDASPYRDREIEVVSNTVIGYETDPASELLRGCVSG